MKSKPCEDDEIVLGTVSIPVSRSGPVLKKDVIRPTLICGKNDAYPRHPITGMPDFDKGRIFRPLRLYLEGPLAYVVVKQIRVGSQQLIFHDWEVPAAKFALGADDPGLESPSLGPGIEVEIALLNRGRSAVTVSARLVGPSVSFRDPVPVTSEAAN